MNKAKLMLKKCLGWNVDVWAHPINEYIKSKGKDTLTCGEALEIGADIHSSMTPFLALYARHLTCGYYNSDSLASIKKRNNSISGRHDLLYEHIDITSMPNKKWDLIITKSVLGGVFRMHETGIKEVRQLVDSIRENNLTEQGRLIIIENGQSIFELFFSHLGARKNGWRFFDSNAFPKALTHHSFGVISAFSIRTRFPFIGALIEKLMYWIDCLLSKLIKRHTVHLWVFDAILLDENDV